MTILREGTTWAVILFSLFEIVDSGGGGTEDVCPLVVAEVYEKVSEQLPPLGVFGGYEANRPVGAGHQAAGAKCVDYSVQIRPEILQDTLLRLLNS